MQLVFIKDKNLKNDPYTTSKVISEHGGQEHESVMRLITKHEKDLKDFGVLRFEIGKPKSEKGGRPEKVCQLNEEQATFLVTLMRNTKQVVEFKKNLVKQFFAMKKELEQRRAEREVELLARKDLTAQIKECLGNNQNEYIKYTQMIYCALFGKNAQQLRDQYGVEDKKKTPKDFMEYENIHLVRIAEYTTLTMLELGHTYYEIKTMLDKKFNKIKKLAI